MATALSSVGLLMLVWVVAILMLSSAAYVRGPVALEVAIVLPCTWIWSGIAAFVLAALLTGVVGMGLGLLGVFSR
jgi:hypothetical protein